MPFLVLGMLVANDFATRPYDPYGERYGVVPMIEGTAHRPFVYRCLLPQAARLVSRKPDMSDLSAEIRPNARQRFFIELWGVHLEHAPATARLFLLMGIAYAAFGYFVMRTALDWALLGRARSLLIGTLAMLIPPLYMDGGARHVYDAGTLAFAAVLTYFALRRLPIWFLVALAPALFAKESLVMLSLLLIVPDLLERRWARALIVSVGVVGLAVAARVLLSRWFGANPGVEVEMRHPDTQEWHWQENLRVLGFIHERSAGFFWRVGLVIAPALFALRFATKPLRIAAIVTTAAIAMPLFFIGRYAEPRVFFEAVPLWLSVAAWGLASQYRDNYSSSSTQPVS